MSQAQMQLNAPDLRKDYPRSPSATLGPYVLLPRILDKCRATLAGTNGEYNFDCPLDKRFFGEFKVDAEAFKAQVAQGKTDEEMLTWVQQNSRGAGDEEALAWSYQTRTARPADPQTMAFFETLRRQVAPNNPFIESWFQLLDADEGRL
jgi:hypothetical protein